MGISSFMEDLVNLKYSDYYVNAGIILLGLIVAFRSNRASGDSGDNNSSGGFWDFGGDSDSSDGGGDD